MSSRGDFRRAVDAALSADVPFQGDTLHDWLAPTQETRIEQIPVDDIADPEWRRPVDAADPSYRALKASVRASGILQPLLVRRLAGGGLQVVSGMRRLRAARDTGQDVVPATIRELSDVQAIVGSAAGRRRHAFGGYRGAAGVAGARRGGGLSGRARCSAACGAGAAACARSAAGRRGCIDRLGAARR
jgi:hypothetical protein